MPLPRINQEAGPARGQGRRRATVVRRTKESALAHGGLQALVTDTDLVGPYNGGSFAMRTSS